MRIRSIHVKQWRHFENIKLLLEENAPLVCIVGANGTGKSHLLELIAACAHRLGLSQGVEIPRGDPFSDPHDISLQFFLAEGVSEAVDHGLSADPWFSEWDRTILIESRNIADNFSRIDAGGIADANGRTQFAARVIDQLRQSQEVHFLSLDADRAYPKKNININQMAEAYEIDWAGVEYTRGRSFKTTSTLYDEWIRYFLAQENQSGTKLMQDMRRAKTQGTEPPIFKDHFEAYAASLQKVLPHLLFTGVDPKKRILLFDTTGLHLTFDQLSGGEREIAFLVGQIDRFGLRQGVFLIDEPELHLNSDLVRIWVSYLTGTVQNGQIWLATHSLEAVEAAGPQATFVLERSDDTRKVNRIARLDALPVLAALSRSVGTPAFSISQLLFVFVEGEEGIGEREHYQKLAGLLSNLRFMEGGSGSDVLRRVATIRSLAKETDTGIRISGVVDRDFKTDAQAASLEQQNGIFVLSVHECENFQLHPVTLEVLLTQNGRTDVPALMLIRNAADVRAGSWIFQYAMATTIAKTLPDISVNAKERAKGLAWSEFEKDEPAAIQSVLSATTYSQDDRQKLGSLLKLGAQAYSRKRVEDTFWKFCEGKQVLNEVARSAGFAGKPAMMQATLATWARDHSIIPDELLAFRKYIETL